jgi:hypothetical protein
MQRYTFYLYLETALHVSGGTSIQHQEAHTTLSTASGICHTVTAICCYRGRVGTGLSVLWVAWDIGMLPQIGLQLLPSTFFPIHNPVVSLAFDALFLTTYHIIENRSLHCAYVGIRVYLIILFNLIVPMLLSPVGDPLSGNKRMWFTESRIIHVISLFNRFIPDN